LNLLGVCIPEDMAAAGLRLHFTWAGVRRAGAVDTFLRVAMSVHTGLNSLTLYAWGTEEQKQNI